MERTLDYIPRHDPRSMAFPALVTGRERRLRRYRYWYSWTHLDQGREGACVGHGVVGALNSNPYKKTIPHVQQAAFGVYRLAQHLDQWEGEAYEGTSVLAGLKVAQKAGLISQYEWCNGIDNVIENVLYRGPVVIGVPWKDSMWQPRPSGLMDISGTTQGGHCVYIRAFSPNRRLRGEGGPKPMFKFRNSWGKAWGKNGGAWIAAEDLETLLRNGEAAIMIQ